MALPPTNITNIVLATTNARRTGYTPIFFTSHRRASNRVLTYTNPDEVLELFSDTEPAYAAALSVFSPTPSVPFFKIARKESDATIAPQNVVLDEVYSITIEVNDEDSVILSYTALGGDTAEDVVDDFLLQITAAVDVDAHITAAKVGTGSAAVLDISPSTAGDFFILSDETTNLLLSYTVTETPAQSLNAAAEEDDDFFFVTADNHSEAFVAALSAEVEARELMYCFSSQNTDSLNDAFDVTNTDAGGVNANNNRDRTFGFWHHTADTTYPELVFVGYNAPFDPKVTAVTWENLRLPLPEALDPDTGNRLTSTQQCNLYDRNMSFMISAGGINYNVGGKVGSSEWIDTIHIRDAIAACVKLGQIILFTSQQGRKIPFTNSGIAQVEQRFRQDVQPFIASQALAGFTLTVTPREITPDLDVSGRIYRGLRATLLLSSAIHRSEFNVTLTTDPDDLNVEP